MKKRIIILITLLMVFCLALTGCGQSSDNTGAADNGQENTVADASGDYNPDTNENPKRNADGWYMYKVDGRDINLKTNVWDYIKPVDGVKVFDSIKMAEDLGWEWSDVDRTDYDTSARGPEWRTRFRLESYSGDFDRSQIYVDFFNSTDHIYQVDTNFETINFDRLDLEDDDPDNTFYLNSTDAYAATVNIEEIIIGCYLFERTTEDTNRCPLITGGIYGPFDSIVVHK